MSITTLTTLLAGTIDRNICGCLIDRWCTARALSGCSRMNSRMIGRSFLRAGTSRDLKRLAVHVIGFSGRSFSSPGPARRPGELTGVVSGSEILSLGCPYLQNNFLSSWCSIHLSGSSFLRAGSISRKTARAWCRDLGPPQVIDGQSGISHSSLRSA